MYLNFLGTFNVEKKKTGIINEQTDRYPKTNRAYQLTQNKFIFFNAKVLTHGYSKQKAESNKKFDWNQ